MTPFLICNRAVLIGRMSCSLVSQMNKCGDPCKCLLSLTATGCVCSLHTLRAISFISVLTYFPSGRCVSVLCQSLFGCVGWQWDLASDLEGQNLVPIWPWHISQSCLQRPVAAVSVAGMWLTDASSAQMLVLIFALSIFLFGCLLGFICLFVLFWVFVLFRWFGLVFFTAVCALKYHPRRWYVNCFRLLKNQWYSTSQPLLHVSWLNRSMDTAKKGFLALEKRYFCASKGGCLKIIQNCRQLNWFLLKVGTDLTVKWRISPTAFQHLQ